MRARPLGGRADVFDNKSAGDPSLIVETLVVRELGKHHFFEAGHPRGHGETLVRFLPDQSFMLADEQFKKAIRRLKSIVVALYQSTYRTIDETFLRGPTSEGAPRLPAPHAFFSLITNRIVSEERTGLYPKCSDDGRCGRLVSCNLARWEPEHFGYNSLS
jgi:hypothetical protein